MPQMRPSSSKTKFDKHFHYVHSVQSADHDANLLWKMYRKNHPGDLPKKILLQEDFCGTAALCYEWAKIGSGFEAVGIDLDQSALTWGENYYGTSSAAAERVQTICGDVLADHNLKPHVICALNFSYFFIDQRALMLSYFKSARASLDSKGLFVLDCFGGPSYLLPHSDKRYNAEEKFHYWWEISTFDAISNKIKCHLHYQRKGESIRKRVFTYDWRLWSVPELSDLLKEAGFQSIQYWAEGISPNGLGDGRYKPVVAERDCQAWVCYIAAKP